MENDEVWEEHRIEPQEFVDAGDRVVVLQREYQRSKSGTELVIDTATVVDLRDGRIVRIQGYMNPAEALKAVSLLGVGDLAGERGDCSPGPRGARPARRRGLPDGRISPDRAHTAGLAARRSDHGPRRDSALLQRDGDVRGGQLLPCRGDQGGERPGAGVLHPHAPAGSAVPRPVCAWPGCTSSRKESSGGSASSPTGPRPSKPWGCRSRPRLGRRRVRASRRWRRRSPPTARHCRPRRRSR